MSPERPPNERRFSLLDSLARVFFATIVLAILANAIALIVVAWITGQVRH